MSRDDTAEPPTRTTVDCPRCRGQGGPCPECRGLGTLRREEPYEPLPDCLVCDDTGTVQRGPDAGGPCQPCGVPA